MKFRFCKSSILCCNKNYFNHADPAQLQLDQLPPSPQGDVISSARGQYKILKPVGTGASGQVFLVLHVHERRKYVMKQVMLEHLAPRDRESTKQEVHLLAGLRHPNIVKFKESYVDDSSLLFLCF